MFNSDIANGLRSHYKRRFAHLHPIPWIQQFKLSLPKVYVAPNLQVTTQELRLDFCQLLLCKKKKERNIHTGRSIISQTLQLLNHRVAGLSLLPVNFMSIV